MVGATLAARSGWFNRWIVRPLARAALPALMRRHVPTSALAGGSALLGGAAALGLWFGQSVGGLLLALCAVALASVATSFAWLRDEAALARALGGWIAVLPAVAALLLAHTVDVMTGELTARVIAVALVVLAALGERAMGATRPLPWGDPPAYLVVLAAGTLIGMPLLGLVAAALYATITLALAIEALRARA